MELSTRQHEKEDLKRIPGVGDKIADQLMALGCRSVEDLKDRDPEELYIALCAQKGEQVDRCVLYVFRSAVYYASNREHDPELLKWWNWKDSGLS
jgi:predicted RecB family nuclease